VSRELIEELELIKSQIGTWEYKNVSTDCEIEAATELAKKKRNAVDWWQSEYKKITQWRRDLADDLRGIYLFASRHGLKLESCLQFAEVVQESTSESERLKVESFSKQLKIESLAEIERYRLLLVELEHSPPNDEEARRQKGLELWNSGKSWAEVATTLDGTPETKNAVKREITRFAKSREFLLRKGQAGAKKKK
jgi:hypothetical protein